MKIIQRLPADRQQLLILKFVEKMTNSEIGVIMGRTEGAIKSLYHRTLLVLREELLAVLAIEISEQESVLKDSAQELIKSRI
jgi:DNA-directed RNA polymerase specialized sigma24 family protein